MTQLQIQESGEDSLLLFMGMGYMEVRDNETEEDLAYWEDKLDMELLSELSSEDKQTSGTKLVITVMWWDT